LPLAEGATPPGAHLYAAIAAREAAGIALRPVICLSSCERGCAAAITMPGKWSYLLGHLSLDLVDDLLEYGAAYAASPSGTVLPSRRAASLRHMVLGRLPALVS
jgi:predicted metal-binding protein